MQQTELFLTSNAGSLEHAGITITVEGIITFSSLLVAIISIFGIIFTVYRWYLHQQEQDKIMSDLQKHHEDDVKKMQKDMQGAWNRIDTNYQEEFAELREEQQMLTYGLLACLDGLSQLNCNGKVTEAKNALDKHLNTQAHKG